MGKTLLFTTSTELIRVSPDAVVYIGAMEIILLSKR